MADIARKVGSKDSRFSYFLIFSYIGTQFARETEGSSRSSSRPSRLKEKGEGGERMRSLFRIARKQNPPTILLISKRTRLEFGFRTRLERRENWKIWSDWPWNGSMSATSQYCHVWYGTKRETFVCHERGCGEKTTFSLITWYFPWKIQSFHWKNWIAIVKISHPSA